MNYRTTFAILVLLGLAPLTRAQQSAAHEPPAITPEDYGLSLTPKYMAEAPVGDPWNDFSDRWHYRSNLSIWAAAISGTVGKGDFQANFDASFSDIADKANVGAGLDFELSKGPFSVLVFAQYLHLQSDAATPRGFDADAKAQFGLVDIALSYEVLNIPVGPDDMRFHFDAMGGFRWTYLSEELDINEGPLAGRNESRERNWFDPYLGARARFDFNRHLNVSVLANYGFFGVGADSTWSAYAQLEYRFDSKWSFILGYRALNYNYSNNGFKFDATMQGPVIGLGIRM